MTDSAPAASSATPSTDGEPPADLGVLLVHGIGRSGAGDTLVDFGEPLVSWLCDWVGDAAKVEVVDAVLGVEAADPATRPHTRVRLTFPDADGEAATREWLIAESWWAESFASPTFRQLADWGIRLVPLTLFFHFSRRSDRAREAMRRAWAGRPRRWRTVVARAGRWLLDFAVLLLALLFAPVFMILLLLLLLGGLVPIPRFRRWIGRLQRGLAVTIGDSYSLLGSKIGSEAIYGRVRRDLDWLSRRCRQTAVVAHSQGAAIAYRAVSDDRSGKCGLLVTFGAGIRKLGQIRRFKEGTSGWVGWVSLALALLILAVQLSRRQLGLGGGLLLAAAVPLAWFGGSALLGLVLRLVLRAYARVTGRAPPPMTERWSLWLGLSSAILTLVPLTIFLPGPTLAGKVWLMLLTFLAWAWIFGAVAVAGSDAAGLRMGLPDDGRARPPGEATLPDTVRWVDLYATHDPVPNGPIFDGIEVPAVDGAVESHGLRTVEVVNRATSLSDHSGYWRNPEAFTSQVGAELGRLDGVELQEIRPFDSERLAIARHRRAWRARWLRRSRLAILASALAVWWTGAAREASGRLYREAAHFVADLPILGRALRSLLPRAPTASPVTELLAVALGAGIALLAVHLAWNRWDGQDRRSLVERRDFRVGDGKFHPATLFHAAWIGVVVTAVLLVLGVGALPWWATALLAIAVLLSAAMLCGLDPYEGPVPQVWKALLRRLGATDAEVEADWQLRTRQRAVVLIDPVERDDGSTVWEAGSTLEVRGPATRWDEVATFDDRDEAIAWGRARVDAVFVGVDGRYQPAPSTDVPPAAGNEAAAGTPQV